MIKLKSNHRHHHRSCSEIRQTKRNFVTLFASSNLKRWIIILFLFYKLDYKDYYCYGISSSSAILNNENGKDLVQSSFISFLFFFFCYEKIFRPSSRKSICYLLGRVALCFSLFLLCVVVSFTFFSSLSVRLYVFRHQEITIQTLIQ